MERIRLEEVSPVDAHRAQEVTPQAFLMSVGDFIATPVPSDHIVTFA